MAKLIYSKRFVDDRGWFVEIYNQRRFRELGVDTIFLQDNHVRSKAIGVLRGLHFQRPPHAQAKLVRCIRGSIWDVIVDVRAGSPTYGDWTAITLSADNEASLLVPIGYAHGYVTLEAETEVLYKVSDFHAPECEGGLAWDDQALAIPWPLPDTGPLLSEKDRLLPPLSELISPFVFDGAPLTRLGD